MKSLKIYLLIIVLLLSSSCSILNREEDSTLNPQLNQDEFGNYEPWWNINII